MTYNDGSNAAPVDYRLRGLTTTLPVDGTKQNYAYTYDLSGNITDIEDLVQTARNRHFTYDGLNRLIEASWPNDSHAQKVTMEYYSNGNIKSKTGLGSNPSSSALTGHDLVYDYDSRLKEISGLGIEFVYDFQGARVKKILGTPPATTTTVYIGNLYECTGSVYTKHILAGGRRIVSKTEAAVIYHHPDHLGGLHLATGSNGSLLQTATYYPFGENNEGSDSGIKYRFTGQEKDFESGLYYYGARFYDPAIGRFISPDTFVQAPGDPQTLNRYAYCRNNPLIYTDPSGHDFGLFSILIGIIIGAALSTTIAAIQGQDLGIAALTGAISGAFFAGAGILAKGLDTVVQAGIYAGAGASAGAINAGISGSNIGIGALAGGAFSLAAFAFPGPNFNVFGQSPVGAIANRMLNSSLTGAVFGAASAAMTGGDVLYGMGMGAAAWAAGEAGNELIGHAVGLISSGGQTPTFKQGAFIYNANFDGAITFGNVITGGKEFLNSPVTINGRDDPLGRTNLQHELSHVTHGTILGPSYVGLNALSLTVGGFIGLGAGAGFEIGTHRYNILESSWIDVPSYY